jgi:hypothetical protein
MLKSEKGLASCSNYKLLVKFSIEKLHGRGFWGLIIYFFNCQYIKKEQNIRNTKSSGYKKY